MKRLKGSFKGLKTFAKHNKRAVFVGAFVLIGGLAVVISSAATSFLSLEAENGTLNGASLISDENASGAQAIQFGTGSSGQPIVIATAGDIADGNLQGQTETAELIKRINPDYVLALGDNAYSNGTLSEYNRNYAPNWGVPEIFDITKPVPGNHEYNTAGAVGYFDYYDPGNTGKVGDRDKGYYSLTVDNWLFLNINSNCSSISGGCTNGGAQAAWVDQQLAANPDKCVVASWHHPRATKGGHSDRTEMNDMWNKIYARDGIVLTGHNHVYTRSYPLGLNAVPSSDGIEQFVVGTGGTNGFYAVEPDSRQAVAIGNTWGVMKLTLQGSSYSYQFIDINDNVLDQGSTTMNCGA